MAAGSGDVAAVRTGDLRVPEQRGKQIGQPMFVARHCVLGKEYEEVASGIGGGEVSRPAMAELPWRYLHHHDAVAAQYGKRRVARAGIDGDLLQDAKPPDLRRNPLQQPIEVLLSILGNE